MWPVWWTDHGGRSSEAPSATGSGLYQLGQRHRTARRCREEKEAFLGDRASARMPQNRGQALAQGGLHHRASRTTVGPRAGTFSPSPARGPWGYPGSPCAYHYLKDAHLKVPLCVTPSEGSPFYTPLSIGYVSTLQGAILQGLPGVSEACAPGCSCLPASSSRAPESGL